MLTGVPATVLCFEASHLQFSVAERMSWYGFRETTRVEDEAYCLLGLFDVHLPPLYGEGRNAFRRLQEEILRQSTDTTLFAWCDALYPKAKAHSYLFAQSPGWFQRFAFAGRVHERSKEFTVSHQSLRAHSSSSSCSIAYRAQLESPRGA